MHQYVIPAFQKIECGEHVKVLKKCSEVVHVAICKKCFKPHYKGFVRCRSKWCLSCSRIKSHIWVRKLSPEFIKWIDDSGHIFMFNLTITDQKSLKKMLELLQKSWSIFTNGRGNRKQFQERFLGGVKSLEVKIGENSGLWHAHYHMIIMSKGFNRDYEWLKEEWEKATAKAFKKPKGTKVGSIFISQVQKGPNMIKSILEAVKYVVKPPDKKQNETISIYEKNHLQEAYDALYRKRQQSTWGLLYGIQKKVETEDLEDEKKTENFICQSCGFTEAEFQSLLYDEINYELYDYGILK